MDNISLALIVGFVFVLGWYCGGRYRKARMEGKTRTQALKALGGGGGGGNPNEPH